MADQRKADSNVSRKTAKAKKDSQLLIRINGEERDKFVALCSSLDTNAAREIRWFIRRFVEERGQS